MRVILFMAMSLNGIIADSSGTEDFLSDDNWKIFCKIVNKTGYLVWGRKTYENIKSWNSKYLKTLKCKKIILSKNKNLRFSNKYDILINSPEEAIKYAEKEGAKEIILAGGASTNLSFIKKGLIDNIILNIEPVIIGEGIPLLGKNKLKINLKLIKSKKLSNNLIQLHYKIL